MFPRVVLDFRQVEQQRWIQSTSICSSALLSDLELCTSSPNSEAEGSLGAGVHVDDSWSDAGDSDSYQDELCESFLSSTTAGAPEVVDIALHVHP